MTLKATSVTPDDIPELAEALSAANLPVADLAETSRSFWRFEDSGGLAGYGGVEGAGADRLLRSVAVQGDRRGTGMGRRIVAAIEAAAAADGTERLHLLTTGSAGFFQSLGYATTDRGSAPVQIARTAQFASLCPGSAAYLVKELQTR